MLRTTHFSELLLAVACAALLLMSASAAFGEIPQRMHYQGYLALANGEPVDCLDPATCSQPVDLTFRIYSDATADALLWEEDHLGVVVMGGHRSALGMWGSLAYANAASRDARGDVVSKRV